MSRDRGMKAGRELDALIAEKVMGWKKGVDFDVVEDYVHGVARYESFGMDVYTFSPSTNIQDAWLVVEKMKSSDTWIGIDTFKNNEMFRCLIINRNNGGHSEGIAETAPLAICLASLKALESEGE